RRSFRSRPTSPVRSHEIGANRAVPCLHQARRHMAQLSVRRRRRAWMIGLGLLLIASVMSAIWRPSLKRRTKWAVVATNVYQDILRSAHLRSDQIGQVTVQAATPEDVDRALQVINSTYNGYLRYSGIDAADMRGKHVLELGPGDNIGVALRFAAAGASAVSA